MRSSASLAAAAILALLTVPPQSTAGDSPWLCPEAHRNVCGDAACSGDYPSAEGALETLKAAVDLTRCSLCRCDTDSSGSVSGADALRVLRASVGLVAELSCPACNNLEAVPTGDSASVETLGYEYSLRALPFPDGGILLLWDDSGAIHARHFSDKLQVQEDETLGTRDSFVSRLAACSRDDGGFAVAWSERTFRNLPRPYDDDNLADTFVWNRSISEGYEPLELYDENAGVQEPVAMVCHENGGLSVYWTSECRGWSYDESNVATAYVPAACSPDPQDGLYRRDFLADGTPTTAPLRVADWPTPYGIQVASRNGVTILRKKDELIVQRDDGATVRRLVLPPSFSTAGTLDCRSDSGECVITGEYPDFTALVMDPVSELPTRVLGIEEGWSIPDYEDRYPADTQFACGTNGICFAVWTLRITTYINGEQFEGWDLGVYGRAVNILTGEIGPTRELSDAPLFFFAPTASVVNVAPDRFLVTLDFGDRIDLSTLEVH